MEEAAFMSPQMFQVVVVPLLGVEKTAVLAISTPDDEYNYYTNLMNVHVDGKPLFKTIKITQGCATCIAAGLPCTHPAGNLPPWKPLGRQDKISAIMKHMPELNARENFGQTISTKQFMVLRSWMNAFREMELYRFRGAGPGVIHMAIDPSGGGQASDYAVALTAYHNSKYIIIGSDTSSSYRKNEIMHMLDTHIIRLRTMPEYKDALLWVYIEANMSFIEADGLANYLLENQYRFGRIVIEANDPKQRGRYGVWTGDVEKKLYAERLQKVMSDGLMRYAENFIAVSRPEAEAKAQLEEQIMNVRKESRPCLEPGFDKVKTTYTGKANGVRDDAAMALQIALYNMERLRNDNYFFAVCEKHGIAF